MRPDNELTFWNQRRNRLRSSKGGWKIGDGIRCQGYSLLDDLLGKVGFFDVLLLHVTGRLPDRRLSQWLEAVFVSMSFPDARIWCNQVSALAGSARCTPVAGVTAGVQASDSSLYGPGSTLTALRFIRGLRQAIDGGDSFETVLARQVFFRGRLRAPGYSRPVARGDDRVTRLDSYAREIGFRHGPHQRLAWQLDRALSARCGDGLNLLGYLAAFWLDQGLDEQQSNTLFSLAVNGGLHACYEEARSNPAGSFLPLRCDDIDYHGVAERQVPVARP